MNSKYDWEWMREYYARSQRNSSTSLKDIAVLFDVPYQSVRRKSAEENWGGLLVYFREYIEYFPNLKVQQQFLELAKPLTRKNYSNVDSILALDSVD